MHQIWRLQSKNNTNRKWLVWCCSSYWYCIRCRLWNFKGHNTQSFLLAIWVIIKKIGTNISYEDSKLLTTMPGDCRVKLSWVHSDKYNFLTFFLCKKEHVALGYSIPAARNYWKHLCFLFILGDLNSFRWKTGTSNCYGIILDLLLS